MTKSTVSANQSASAGGIMNDVGATATLTRSILEGNNATIGSGGGIATVGTATVSDSVVSGNSATEEGGGIRNEAPGTLVVRRSTVSGNSAGTFGGGIRNHGVTQVSDTTVSNNAANGAAGISNGSAGIVTIDGSTIHGNTSSGGAGGIASFQGTVTVTNTTVSGNESDGAAISNVQSGTMTLVNTTVSGNIGAEGATGVSNFASLSTRNMIIDGGCGAGPLMLPIDSLGGNIESEGNTCGFSQPTDLVNVPTTALNLGPLVDNGGPTLTHALLPGSVAIDSAEECVNAAGFPLLVDQRGAPRPYGPACDSGSFEFGAVPLPGDLCINDVDRVVYESLTYVNGGGIPSTCIDAATAIAANCVFGSAQSSPPIAGCPAEIGALIACYPNCTPEVIEAVDQCIAACTAGVTGLSTECAGCYGGWAGCAAHVCVPECAGGVGLPSCTDCLSASGCTGLFNACTGLPGDIECTDLCAGVVCDDGAECTEGVCNPITGTCEYAPSPDGTRCSLGYCAAGVCASVEPLESCAQVLDQEPTAPSGIYTLNLGFGSPKPVYCDMDHEGGGWTLVASMNGWDFCGANPPPENDLLTDPTKTNGKISDAVVEGIRAGSGRYEVMYYLGLPGRSEYLWANIDSPWSTLGGDLTHCTWTCADGNADSTTCEDESYGCGFGGTGTGGDTKKLYMGFNGGLHSGGDFCGLDNRPFYPVQVFVR